MAEIVLKDESYAIVGACFEVYNELGCGFLEAVYQEALQLELGAKQIPYVPQSPLLIHYKGQPLIQAYRADLVCYGSILVELKAVSYINDDHRAQLLNYLHATKMPLGLLINFGHSKGLQQERFLPRT
jgi:GxxExxY protein